MATTSRADAGLWYLFDAFTTNAAKRWRGPAARILEQEQRDVSRAYLNGGAAAALAAVDADAWLHFVSRVWLAVAPEGGAMIAAVIGDLAKAAPADPVTAAAVDWIRKNGEDRALEITNASRRNIADQIRIGVSKGETDAQIAQRITKHYKRVTPARAATIARTTTHAAANFGSLSAAETAAVPVRKIWLATPDDRTRDTHRRAHRQNRAIGESFDVGFSQLMYPGDSSLGADAAETVNCRCTLGYKRGATTPAKPRRPRRAA